MDSILPGGVALSILYPVPRRAIVLCDYSLGGFRPPEMVKRRPAVVVSPRLPHRNGLFSVVALSGTEPEKPVPYVVRIELGEPLPAPFSASVWWAKCDMVATVAAERLDLFRTARSPEGKRKFIQPRLDAEVFQSLMLGVLYGLGLDHLTLSPPHPHWS
jgi:mRNA interferase MazF